MLAAYVSQTKMLYYYKMSQALWYVRELGKLHRNNMVCFRMRYDAEQRKVSVFEPHLNKHEKKENRSDGLLA